VSGRGYWEELERPPPDFVAVADGVELRRGSRVRLRPRRRGDVFDTALEGKAAVVESIEQDMEENVSLTVTLDEDPGRDLGERRIPGHRFFFSPDEVEPLGDAAPTGEPGAATDATGPRVLVAGIGNVFLGDDGFGVELAGRLARQELPAGAEVVDFGIRGLDLAYALGDYDVAVLLDATPRGQAPGTLYVIEAELDEGGPGPDAHGMDPVKVLALARALGGELPRVLVVGCEPATALDPEHDEMVMELSEPVRAALDEAVRLVGELLEDVTGPVAGRNARDESNRRETGA
jgi:hydrogenase maturation protease